MSESLGKIAILGAAGATGKAVAQELANRGAEFRLVGRRIPRIKEAFPNLTAEIVAADLETNEGAALAVSGIDTVVMTLGLPYTEFSRYPPMMNHVVQAAEAAGVRRFLLVTNIYSYGAPQGDPIDESHPRNPHTFKGQMRLDQEQILERSKLEWLILRLPDFFGPEAEFSHARLICEAALANKSADLFHPATTRHQFVYTADVGPIVADLLRLDKGWRETYHFAGSGIITVEEFAEIAFRIAGKPLKERVSRTWLIRLLGLFSPMMREFVEMMYLHETPVNLSDAKLERLLGPLRRTRYDEGIHESLERMRMRPFLPMPK